MEKIIQEALSGHVGETGGLITGLRHVQERCGFVPSETVRIAAELFNISQAEVRGVISFYADFRDKKPGQHHIRLCVAEACQSVGARAIEEDLLNRFAVRMGETDAADFVTIEPVYCLGLCSCAPAAEVNGKLIARVDGQRIADEVVS
ncbi:NAD(P)H-dependent oxidoreductase subunit E [Maritalea porphyrae]|uniref:NAD(P)H-dependent oxidoreductase subunit E n=1 Tax=Maritalea porphyrae TaxID=880732 RepID=UPI0022AFEEDE|nr:NAD(P)H-dependent oxidoreductase subunit E [Maritalea porphyrae]MCZ4272546.1 NAD(P)H-dependent oxidoreductase subunit E [Maritalea porphyrae]